MKNKYVMINGLAFSEEGDLEKLKKYASEGWILENIVGGLFYKLRKDKPQNIVYSLDYQSEADEDYFTIFKEAGWSHVLSISNQMHIFLAEAGTKPIYSDSKSEIDKYINVRNQTRKGSIYSLIIAIVLIGLLGISAIALRPVFLIILSLLVFDFIVFIFNFMPYLAYNSRVKQIKKYGKCDGKAIYNKSSWKLQAVAGVLWLAIGIWYLIEKHYYSAVFFIIFGAFFIFSSLSHLKNYKKSL